MDYQAIQTLKSFSAALYTGSVILAIKREKWKYIDIFNLKQNTFHSTWEWKSCDSENNSFFKSI